MLKITPSGEANFYFLETENKWLANIQFNGELMPHKQEEIVRRWASSEELYDAVYAMRTFQRLYFKTRDRTVMAQSIAMEKMVDKLLEEQHD